MSYNIIHITLYRSCGQCILYCILCIMFKPRVEIKSVLIKVEAWLVSPLQQACVIWYTVGIKCIRAIDTHLHQQSWVRVKWRGENNFLTDLNQVQFTSNKAEKVKIPSSTIYIEKLSNGGIFTFLSYLKYRSPDIALRKTVTVFRRFCIHFQVMQHKTSIAKFVKF